MTRRMPRPPVTFHGGPNDGTGRWAPPPGPDGTPPTTLEFLGIGREGGKPDAPVVTVTHRYVRRVTVEADGSWTYDYAGELSRP